LVSPQLRWRKATPRIWGCASSKAPLPALRAAVALLLSGLWPASGLPAPAPTSTPFLELPSACDEMPEAFICASFDPKGDTLAIAGEMKGASPVGLILWDLKNDCQHVIIKNNLSSVRAFAYSRDGTRFATGHTDGAVRVWDAATCRQLAELKGHANWVSLVAFSPDGKTLATFGIDYHFQIVLWDIGTEKAKKTFNFTEDSPYFRGVVDALTFSPDGKVLAATGRDGAIRFINPETGDVVDGAGAWKQDQFWSAAFSPDGKTFATVGETDVTLWDVSPLARRTVFKGGPAHCVAVAFSPDGRLLAASYDDGLIKIRDPQSGKERLSFNSPCGIRCLSFSHDSRLLAVSGDGRRHNLGVWDLTTGREITKHSDP